MILILKKKKSLQSYKIIEEFMILTNTIIANLLINKKVHAIFRNHEKPKKEKISLLKEILNENGFNIKKFKYDIQSDFRETIKIINRSKKIFFNNTLLKTQSKAYYNSINKGHFGLALEKYTHFTSPIRRYSDLIVHRKVVDILFSKKKNIDNENISEHLTTQEKKADLIERNIIERACSLYIKKLKHYEFEGIIDGIEGFGIFIRSIDFPFSGLVRFKEDFSQKKSLKNLKLGQLVKFKIKKNNVRTGKILLDKVRINDG